MPETLTPPPMTRPPMPPRTPAPGPTAPAAVSTQNRGQKMQGMVRAAFGVKMLENALPLLGATTEEGQAVLKALSGLSKMFPQPSPDLTAAELKLMQAKAPGMSPMPPTGTREQMMQRLQGMGLGQRPPSTPTPAAGAQ